MAENEFYQKKDHTVTIWLSALILLIILLLSLFWLAPLLWNVDDPNSNVIPLLYEGDCQIVSNGTLQYITAEEEPEMITHDDNIEWEIRTDVDLFKTEYYGPDGTITVESDNGDKIIAPGTSHDYSFSLRNVGNISLDYVMELDSLFTLQNHDLPIQVRLRRGGAWIVGGNDDWKEIDALGNVLEKGTLDVGQAAEYTFEWLWPYEDGIDDVLLLNDMNDIIAANAAVEQNVNFHLEIVTTSEVTPGAIPTNPDGSPLYVPLVRWNIWNHIVLPGLLAGAGIILILIFRRPVYLTGLALATPMAEMSLGKKKDKLRLDGRFVFKKIYTGKHTLKLATGECNVKIKRSRKVEALGFRKEDDCLVVLIHPGTRALELHLQLLGSKVVIDELNWATIDSKNRVHTPLGVKEPVNKRNQTKDGLMVDEKGNLDINVRTMVG